jgi:hemolysin activation/secretion protein
LGGTAELRYNWPLRLSILQTLQPYAFFDAARVWNVQQTGPLGRSIDSVGGGIRAWMDYGVFANLEVAQTLEPTPGSDGGKKATKLLVNLGAEF